MFMCATAVYHGELSQYTWTKCGSALSPSLASQLMSILAMAR